MSKADHKPYEKNHSFSKSISLAQGASWAIFLSESLVFYIYVLNQFQNNNFRIAMGVFFSLSLIMVIIYAILTGQVDPTDELVIATRNKDMEKIISEKSKLVKLFYCPLCTSAVKNKTRHCRTCSSCSQNFDHHCMWLNICIGGKNYNYFIITIVMTFANFFFYLLAISFLTQEMRIAQTDMKTAGFSIMWIVGIVVVVFEFLVTNLILLHIYLKYKGISTYEFVMLRAQEKLKQQEEETKKQLDKKEAEKVQKLKIKQAQEEQNSTAFLHEQKHNKLKSIDDTIIEDKIQRENDKKSESISSSNSEHSECTKKFKEVSAEPSEDQQRGKMYNSQPSEGRVNIVKNSLSLNNSQVQALEKSQVSANKAQKSQTEKEDPSTTDFNSNKNKYFTQKTKTKKQINPFFFKNASFDLIFMNSCQTIQPQDNLCKAIELDQQIKEFKKRKQNHSLVIESAVSDESAQRNSKWGMFHARKNKKAVQDVSIKFEGQAETPLQVSSTKQK